MLWAFVRNMAPLFGVCLFSAAIWGIWKLTDLFYKHLGKLR